MDTDFGVIGTRRWSQGFKTHKGFSWRIKIMDTNWVNSLKKY